jgi:hypothetical protein
MPMLVKVLMVILCAMGIPLTDSFGNSKPIRALDLSFEEDGVINLQTSVEKFQRNVLISSPEIYPTMGKVHLDLYSMLHVADLSYYQQIDSLLSSYDLVLYELITSRNNTLSMLSSTSSSFYKKQLANEIYSPQAEILASQLGLGTQLKNLYLKNKHKRQWFIADLDSETISLMERKNKDNIITRYYLSKLFGRTFSEQLLLKFYLSDRVKDSNINERMICHDHHDSLRRCLSPCSGWRVGLPRVQN